MSEDRITQLSARDETWLRRADPVRLSRLIDVASGGFIGKPEGEFRRDESAVGADPAREAEAGLSE